MVKLRFWLELRCRNSNWIESPAGELNIVLSLCWATEPLVYHSVWGSWSIVLSSHWFLDLSGFWSTQVCWPCQTDPLQRCDQRGPQQPPGARAEGGSVSPQRPAVRTGPGRHYREWVCYSKTQTHTNTDLDIVAACFSSQIQNRGLELHLRVCVSHTFLSLLCPISISVHRPCHHWFEMCV